MMELVSQSQSPTPKRGICMMRPSLRKDICCEVQALVWTQSRCFCFVPQLQRLIDLVLTCKRNAENEVIGKETGGEMPPGRKRRLEQETAERALKFLKASQESRKYCKIPGEMIERCSSPWQQRKCVCIRGVAVSALICNPNPNPSSPR